MSSFLSTRYSNSEKARPKASRTKVAIAWTLDPHEMRGDKIELLSSFETKIKDYISDVQAAPRANI